MHAPEHHPDHGPNRTAGEELRYRRPVLDSARDSWDHEQFETAHADAYEADQAAARPAAATPLHGSRSRALLLAGTVLLLLLVVAAAWYAEPTNRARRELAQANARIQEKQRELDDARRLLDRRQAELRAARAEAEVYATVYRGVLEREGRADQANAALVNATVGAAPAARATNVPITSSAATGEVQLPPVAPRR
jgi:hypothetical protein